jgi:hypothetical protein
VSDCPSLGHSLSFYSLPCQLEPQWRLQNKQKRERTKRMFTNKEQANSPNRGAVNSTRAVAANNASPKPARQRATHPSNVDIATKAYEIWLSSGQEMGKDQQHWFEAEQQLQRA